MYCVFNVHFNVMCFFLQRDVNEVVQQTLKSIKVADKGVCVQASTLGSLEALLEFLKTSKIPVSISNSYTVRD